jgi:hypothetical protein
MSRLSTGQDFANGPVLAQCKPRHRHQEFLAFLRHIEREVPQDLDVHLIVDNYGTHKHAKVKSLAGAPYAFSPALHTHLFLLAEPSRALVRPYHPARDPPRLLLVGHRPAPSDRALRHRLESTSSSIQMDRYRRIHPRQTRTVR